MCGGQHEGKDQMANNEQQGSEHEHGGTFTLIVEIGSEERGDDGCTDGEPAEDIGGCLWADAVEVALQHVGSVALEGEYGTVVEYAQQGDDPEDAATKYLANVAYLELVFWIHLGAFTFAKLGIEFAIHYAENQEEDESDAEQHCAEGDRGDNGGLSEDAVTQAFGKQRADAEDGENANAGDSHLESHGKSHLFALEPFSNGATDGDAGHFASASEDHESEGGHLCTAGHGGPPAAEPFAECCLLEEVADANKLDDGTKQHHAGAEGAGETDAHLVEDDTGKDEESAYVEYVFAGGIGAEDTGCPSTFHFNHALQGRHYIDKHIAEEHHQGNQDQR